MLTELNRADCSRIHVAIMDALGVPKTEPETPEEASKQAFAEAIAFYSDHPSTKLGDLLDAAHAVRSFLEIETGGAETPIEFDIGSIMNATGFKEYDAAMVARLCGAMPFQSGNGTQWKNCNSVVGPFQFPQELMDV